MTKKPCAAFIFLAFLLSSLPAFAGITGYRPIFAPFYEEEHLRIAIREFQRDSKKELLILDPYSFETGIVATEGIKLQKPHGIGESRLLATPFYAALAGYTAPPVRLHNHGATSGNGKGLFLTVDMCPSRKRFDRELFDALMTLPGFEARPAPVAIAISGDWLRLHPKEFKWIMERIKAKRLDVTWVNHSYSHPYEKEAPPQENFLLKKGVNFKSEVLANEVLMIESGIMPSPFFRFPGLVAGPEVMEKLKALSLIPIGSNAWLAKGETPVDGSIVLVHGNGNEPAGGRRLLKLFKDRKADLQNGSLALHPLKGAFTSEQIGNHIR